jgi:chromate transporter
MIIERVWQLIEAIAPLSLFAVGGVQSIMPELYRQLVEVRGLVGETEFAALYALAQVAPGPNGLVVSLYGWKVAGLAGAVGALVAVLGPSSILTYLVARAWTRLGDAPWWAAVRAGLAPVAVGLVLSSGLILSSGAASGSWLLWSIIGVTALLVLKTKVHPLVWFGVGAAANVVATSIGV